MRNFKTIFFTIIFILLSTSILKASDFNITSNYNIYLHNIRDDFVTVEEELEIKVSNSEYYIPKGSNQTITVQKDSMVKNTLEVLNKFNQAKNFTIQENDESLEVVIRNSADIKRDSPFFAKIRYKTQEFVNQNGNITNLYLPGLHKDIIFEKTDPTNNLKTKNEYFLSYHIPTDAPEHSFISPDTISFSVEKDLRTYKFPQNARIGNSGWIQLGNEQYYFFRISQKIPKTDFFTPEQLSKYTGWLSKNVLELTLPREFEENNQEVFFSKIHPKPTRIRSDEEGNIIAVFENEPTQEDEVVIEGYIKLSQKAKEIPSFTIEEYMRRIKELNRLEIYTKEDKNWESQNQQIREIARDLQSKNNNLNILDLIRDNYDFVIEHLEYDREKADGANERLGALRALQSKQGVCMEYADLLIAILRAQGIPARAAFGYGNDPLVEETENRVGHQWVQVWYPDYGWLSIDPTWGETGREYIGGDLDHLLWYTSGDSNLRIADSIIYSADSITQDVLSEYNVETVPLHKNDVPDFSNLNMISDIIMEYSTENEEITDFETTLKTTILGRALIFVIPIGIVVISLITISIAISKLFKRKKEPMHN